MAEIVQILELSVEEAGDYIFSPAGIVMVFKNKRFQLFTESARHNFLRRIVTRHSWEQLFETVNDGGTSARLRDITEEVANKSGPDELSIEAVLQICYDTNPRQLFFLQRYFTNSPSQASMPPS
ncbi:hypothetical protein [Alicyclobacillus fodiniaquatilis]|uniref:Uncharacterized protein n=1 Tax=Alicyclobacillus fodiniaquatilis TaxID=1661150 RepID=A0ABW4JFF5_9BACL